MHTRFIRLRGHWRRNLILVTFGLLAAAASAQMIDLNSNGMSDVWEWIYGATGASPTADADGDGFSNQQEATAGTNPFDSNSIPKISLVTLAGTNASAVLPSALGKFYQLQSVPFLNAGSLSNWTGETSVIARTGTVATLTASATASAKFFRVATADVDSDGDGINDWEEYKLGLNPTNAYSNGQIDTNGQPMTDYAYVAGKMVVQNIITAYATDPTALQPDPGQSPIANGLYTISRGGFPLNSITVNLGLGGPGAGFAVSNVDYAALPTTVILPAGVSSQDITLTPLANTNLAAPVIAMLKILSGAGYTIGGASNASVVIYPSSSPNGSGLTAQYFTNSTTTYASNKNFNATNLILTRIDPVIDFVWGGTNPPPNLSNGLYCVRWTGQLQPQYSENYFFDVRSDDGVKLWVNDQLIIDKWVSQSVTDWTNAIPLQADTRYNIKLEYLQNGGSGQAHLYWYSASQAKQVIPANRLYPTNSIGGSTNAAAVITSSLSAVAFLGQPFTNSVTGANTPLGFTAKGLPPGLSFNTTNGIIGGIPTLAGDFQVMLTASNAVGSGASVLDLLVIDTGSAVTREVWTNVAGINISNIPVNVAASSSAAFGNLEGITNFGDNYGERIRGYLTAPVTGNYYFWIAGSDSAELWIANDSEPANKVKRCWVSPTNNPAPPPANGTAARQWNVQPNQKSPWLALVAGQKYYLEVLHKAGADTNDNWAVGWLQDPTGTNNTPAGIVPGYVLSRYFDLPPSLIPGTLYSANMLAQGTAVSTAVGSATLRLSADGTQAVLNRSFSGLSSPMTGEHIHCDAYLNSPSQIMFDIDQATPQPDGSFVWNIAAVGTLSAADIVEIIREGKSYINIHTVNYPGGEINGHFTQAEGSQTFTPPPAPFIWADDHTTTNAAARFLIQATFGPSQADIAAVQSVGYDAWLNSQFATPPSYHLAKVLANVSSDPSNPYPGTLMFNTWWQQSVTAPDQLRQRVAFALSEIMVVSENGVLQDNARVLADYYDVLLDNCFGNFRELLEQVTLSPAMGLYLDMRRNDKGDLAAGTHANENYAREILQLFSVGLNREWPDGTLILNSHGNLVPTYDQNVVNGFAANFTGWNYYQTNQANGRLPVNWNPNANYTNQMVLVPSHHDSGAKRLLDNVVLPPAQGLQIFSTNVEYDAYAAQDLEKALDNIFYNENCGPFICRQLIQRLVTSNPSRDYVYRVVQKFNDNGAGVRGDMQAVIKAILLDYEARSTNVLALSTYGKQREPLLRVTATARAFPAPPAMTATYSESGDRTITLTTPTAHRLNNNDTILLSFTDTSGNAAPPSQSYSVTATGTNTFTVNAPNLLNGTYTQSTNTITVNISNHGLLPGSAVYLVFSTGGAANGLYQVVGTNSTSSFRVSTPDAAVRSGNCLFPKLSASGFTQTGTNVTVSCAGPHGFVVGESLYVIFNVALPVTGQYQVATIPDATHFTLIATNSTTQTQGGFSIYPLGPPVLTRSGTAVMQQSTWAMNTTDTGTTSSLLQTPLSSPTVFNFYFPDYKFPGLLASAGLTTPEFQLTSDTGVVLQMNFLEGGILNNTGNTNGLSSFAGGNGAIVLDLGPWMTTNYTADAGVSNLVSNLNTLLLAGQLSARSQTNITGFVASTNFTYGSPPTATQMRDRVRAVVHLITASPDFTIQK